jgi:uncharacterized protein (TIGR00269 family)
MLNMLHGGVRRLTDLSPASDEVPGLVRRIKPFCRTPESEIAFYAFLRGIDFQSTPCPYMHGSMRSRIRMFLNRMEMFHPGVKFTLTSSIEALSLFQKSTEVKYAYCKECGEPAAGPLCRTCELLPKLKET